MMNEISKTAINAVMNLIVKNNETNDTPKQDTSKSKVDTELNDVRNKRNKPHVLPVASNDTDKQDTSKSKVDNELNEVHDDIQNKPQVLPVASTEYDASITVEDLSYNDDKKDDKIETTYLEVDPKDTSKFIITRK
jgi:spore germination protein GerM